MKKLIILLFFGAGSTVSAFDRGLPLGLEDAPAIVSQLTREKVGWDFSISATFNGYIAMQDSMEIAFPGSTPVGNVVVIDYKYKPGFDIGFVFNTPFEGWSLCGEYLWFRGTSHASKPGGGAVPYTSPILVGPFDISIGSIESDWRLGMDIIDLYLSRSYYSGKHLSLSPFLGLRNTWIRDHFELKASKFVALSNVDRAITTSRAAGIGPRVGFQGNFLFNRGLSLFGNLATSFLYTNYNTLKLIYINYLGEESNLDNDGAKTFRSILESGIGLNWESRGPHKITVNLAYNLAVFFSQNMERTLVSLAESTSVAPGNLYLSGVSIGASVVF